MVYHNWVQVAPYCVPLPDRMVIYNAQLTAERYGKYKIIQYSV